MELSLGDLCKAWYLRNEMIMKYVIHLLWRRKSKVLGKVKGGYQGLGDLIFRKHLISHLRSESSNAEDVAKLSFNFNYN